MKTINKADKEAQKPEAIRRFKGYPACKNSGIEWLGEVPEHWEVLPFKRLGDFQAGAGFPDDEQGMTDEELPFYKVSDTNLEGNEAFMVVHNNSITRDTATRLRAFVFPPEAIIFAKVGAALLLNKRRILTRESCIDNNMIGFMRKNCELEWVYYWLCGLDLGRLANPGAVPSINEGQLREIPVPVPSFDEQRAIAAFLDRETVRIDGLIEKKERQIELLQEKRTTLISHAVTKGLNPNAKMKDSGIEWLGEIPEHWEIRKLKHVASVWFSNVDKHTVEGEEPVRLCNYVDVYYNEYIADGLEFMAATATRGEIAKFRLQQGDVLITKDSESWDDIAVPAYVATNLDGVLCGYHLAQLRPDPRKVHGKYLFRAFRTRGINDQFRVAATGITRFGLGKYWLDNGIFPVPPISEQRAIAAFLDRETVRIDVLKEKNRESIEKLREYRTALISAAVTGKIDVRKKPQ